MNVCACMYVCGHANSTMRTQNVAWKTSRKRWRMETDGEKRERERVRETSVSSMT